MVWETTDGRPSGASARAYPDYAEAVQNIAELQAITVTARVDKQQRLVEDKKTAYWFDDTGTGTHDGDLIIAPDAGSGRWFKIVEGGTPTPHAPTHQDTGADEISVTGLSGLLATDQNPVDHAVDHQDAGGDELVVTGLAGLLTDDQNPLPHASEHEVTGNDEFTKLLLHMNGDEGGTSFPDASVGGGHSPTVVGSMHTHRTSPDPVFGEASAHFDGSNDFISVPGHPDWGFGTEDFTVDLRFYIVSTGLDATFCAVHVNSANHWYMCWDPSGNIRLFNANPVQSLNLYFSWVPTINTWYHLAIVRYGDTYNVAIDGVFIGAQTPTSMSWPDHGGSVLRIGHEGQSGKDFRGHMDEFRISKGIARWTSDFTPPTMAYPMGPDVISVAGLSGLLADEQDPLDHAADHSKDGGDDVSAENLASGSSDVSAALRPDGSGGVAFSDVDHGEVVGVGVDDHHAQLHAAEHVTGGGDAVTLDAAQVELEEIGVATRDDVQDMFNILSSPSLLSGGALTAHAPADGTIDIAAGTAMVKVSDSETALTKFFDFNAAASLALVDLSLNYIYVDYSGGTPVVRATTQLDVMFQSDSVELGIVFRDGTVVHVREFGLVGASAAKKSCKRLTEKWGAERVLGTMISAIGTRNFALTSGVNYLGCFRALSPAFDTSGTDRFSYWYYGNAGPAWVEVTAQAQIDETRYNNYGANPGLVALGNNKFGVHWVYLDKNLDHLHVVYGQGDHSSAEAQAAQPPVQLPPVVAQFGMLVGKIIIKKDDAFFTLIVSPFEVSFGSNMVTEHNDLAAIQGGQAAEYYHLNSAEHTEATRDATGSQKGLATSAQVTMLEAHADRHADAGLDELSVTDLSGLLADDQNPKPHAVDHQNGGVDFINVTDLSGVLADDQNPKLHAIKHQPAGGDELNVESLPTAAVDNLVPVSATGGLVMGPVPDHASRHEGADDAITVENLATMGVSGTIPVSDGAGLVMGPVPDHASRHSKSAADPVTVEDLTTMGQEKQVPVVSAGALVMSDIEGLRTAGAVGKVPVATGVSNGLSMGNVEDIATASATAGEVPISDGGGGLIMGVVPDHAAAHAENQGDEILVEALGTGEAVLGKVLVADGAGGVAMLRPPIDGITIVDEKASGTAGGTFPSLTWTRRDLNVKTADSGGHAAVSGNQITLQPGKYIVYISAPAYKVNLHKARLLNVTDTTYIYGTTEETGGGDGVVTRSIIVGLISFTTTKVFEVWHFATSTRNDDGFGRPIGLSAIAEVYTIVQFTRIGPAS